MNIKAELAAVLLAVACLFAACGSAAVSSSVAVSSVSAVYRIQTLPVGQQLILEKAAGAYERAQARAAVQPGDCYGTVWVEDTSIHCDLYYDDTQAVFDLGAGTHINGHLPGEGGTVMIGAHTSTYFVGLRDVVVGSRIHLDTLWGSYVYEVREMQQVHETDIAACHLAGTEEMCELYTCYPFGQTAPTEYRWFVYAYPVEMPQ